MVYAWNRMLNIVEYKDKHKIDIGSYIKVKRELVKFSAVNMKEIGSNPIHITKRVNARKNNGGYVFSNETRKKMSDAKLGKTMSTLTKEKISKSNKGKPKSPEHNKKCQMHLLVEHIILRLEKKYRTLK